MLVCCCKLLKPKICYLVSSRGFPVIIIIIIIIIKMLKTEGAATGKVDIQLSVGDRLATRVCGITTMQCLSKRN